MIPSEDIETDFVFDRLSGSFLIHKEKKRKKYYRKNKIHVMNIRHGIEMSAHNITVEF